MELRGDLPVRASGLLEGDGDRPIVLAVRPHHRRRHVDVRVGLVDGEVRAVHAIAVDLVLHRDAAAMAADVPAVRIRPCRLDLARVRAERVHVVDVLREIVQRVAARRRSAHPQLERARADVRETSPRPASSDAAAPETSRDTGSARRRESDRRGEQNHDRSRQALMIADFTHLAHVRSWLRAPRDARTGTRTSGWPRAAT